MKAGAYRELSRKDYESIEAVNFSTLKHFSRSAAHAREYMLHPQKPSDSMELGSAIHMAILEPERFNREYVLCPSFDRRTKEGKAAWLKFESENPGRGYLDQYEWEQCQGMLKAAESNEIASQLLFAGGRNEMTIVWQDSETQLWCKARIDKFCKFYGYSIVLDIKSTQNANERIFASLAARLQYHVQAAFYLEGLNVIAPLERRFVTLVIEKDRPHGIQIFEMDEAAIQAGRNEFRRYLTQYAECVKTNNWPGYMVGITPLSLPRWVTMEDFND